ncbi:protein-disulfide isomerase-like protein with CxxC motif [Variovorax sp. GrIS 2.14]|uniref:hypothetical protein n=1 Tax=Variovorax sp. GrIS 2.14 TaxID=3071709 RepID=UPI0038F72752
MDYEQVPQQIRTRIPAPPRHVIEQDTGQRFSVVAIHENGTREQMVCGYPIWMAQRVKTSADAYAHRKYGRELRALQRAQRAPDAAKDAA